jgi:RNA polymerase sigma-70 factor (ECF subfamily)
MSMLRAFDAPVGSVYTPDRLPASRQRGAITDSAGAADHQSPDAQVTDEALMARLVLRDAGALEALYDRHARAVYSLALRLLADRAAAEEVVQDCFLKLWRAPHTYQPQRGKPLTWLLGITHHRAVDELRRRRVERRVVEHTVNGDTHEFAISEDPLQALWRDADRETVTNALGALPPEQRLVLQLAYYDGMTQVEIADRLSQPLGTVKTRMRLGLRKLRSLAGVDHAER